MTNLRPEDSLEALAHVSEDLLGLSVGGDDAVGLELLKAALVSVELLLQLLDVGGALLILLLEHSLDAGDLLLIGRRGALQVLVHVV